MRHVRSTRGRAAAAALCMIVGALGACAGGDSRPAGPPGPEFLRHLRLGVEQLRRQLPESARAELDKCATLRPQDPDLLFHQARLRLMGGTDTAGAIELLERAIAADPASVKARKLLYELELRSGDRAAALEHRTAVIAAYGQLGELEMMSYDAFFNREPEPYLRFPAFRPDAPHAADYRAMKTALGQLQRAGDFAPSSAVPVVERLLREYPDLAMVRAHYAEQLIYREIRVNYSDRPDLPPMSSALIMDMAQTHCERVLDLLQPGSPMTPKTIFALSDVALLMADYDEMVTWTDILLERWGRQGAGRRRLLGRRGLARYKQRRYGEAIELLERALAGDNTNFPKEPALRWVLHLAYEGAGTAPGARAGDFRLRADLVDPPVACPFSFEDIAPQLGIDKLDGLGPSAWADYDRDGDFDLFVTGSDSYGALYRNDGSAFTDVSREAGLFHVQSGFSATFVDVDGDGAPDIHIGRDGWNGEAGNSFYRNVGDGTFADRTEETGVGDPGASFVCAWSDVDRDGDPDLYVANGITGAGDTNVLYRNNGDGTFSDATVEAGLQEPSGTKTIGVAFGDYDLDGWPDLFVSGYKTLNRLYRNRGDGTFDEVAAEAGVAGAEHLSTGYVCFFVDYDNDLYPDILRASLAPWNEVLLALSARFDFLPQAVRQSLLKNAPKLYRNDGDGTFTEVSECAGLVHPIGIMGTGVADLDNDGYLDIYFGTGDPSIERMEPDRFYRGSADGTFTDLTFVSGLGNVGKGHGVTFVDHDRDGDLEIYAPEGGFVHGDPWPNAFYVNRQDTGNHWLHVDLEGVHGNRDALDARLVVTAGELQVAREVHNGEGFGSSNSPTVEFGLGQAERIDRLEIRWSSGTLQTFEDVPIDRRIFVREGSGWEEVAADR